MPIKKIIVIVVAALFAGLMIWANMDDGTGEKTTDGVAEQPASLQKNLPSEERIPRAQRGSTSRLRHDKGPNTSNDPAMGLTVP